MPPRGGDRRWAGRELSRANRFCRSYSVDPVPRGQEFPFIIRSPHLPSTSFIALPPPSPFPGHRRLVSTPLSLRRYLFDLENVLVNRDGPTDSRIFFRETENPNTIIIQSDSSTMNPGQLSRNDIDILYFHPPPAQSL